MKKTLFILTLALTVNAFAQVPTNGLVAYYPFTGNANDYSGNGNNGTVNGATLTTDRFGNPNAAYSFNGSNNYIGLGINQKIDSIFGDFSLSYWINTPVSQYQTVLSSYSNQSGTNWRFISRITYDSAMTDFNAVPNISWQHIDSHNAIQLNQWKNLIMVRIGTAYSIYVNGVLVNTSTVSPNTINNPTSPYATTSIGYNLAGTGSEFFKGSIDDIAFYNRGLNSTEINNLYTVSQSTCMQGRIGVGYSAGTQTVLNPDTSQWHYIAITKASNLQNQIYLDGQLVIDTFFQNLSYSYNSLYLATAYFTSFTSFFKGDIDEFRMSNKVRTALEIQTHYTSNAPFSTDANTIDLWHFDEPNGSTIFANAVSSTNGTLFNNPQFKTGRFSNAIYFDGISQYGNCNVSIPTSNITFEFWFKTNTTASNNSMIQAYGAYNTSIYYNVTVHPSPVTPTVSANMSTLTSSSSTGNQWYMNGNIISGATSQSYSVTQNALYSVCVDSNGCSACSTPYNFTTTGIKDLSIEKNITVSPNPSIGILQITSEKLPMTSVDFYNVMGEKVYSSIINSQSASLNLDLPNGVYFIQIKTAQGTAIKKIIISK